MIYRTFHRLRKVQVTIPQLSPTHTKARIVKFCIPLHQEPHPQESSNTDKNLKKEVVELVSSSSSSSTSSTYLECYDPLFIVQCSPDLVTPGYRLYDDHCPFMIVEAHDEGFFKMVDKNKVVIGEWYNVGHVVGVIDDQDEDDDDGSINGDGSSIMSEWLWQAYAHTEDEEDKKR
jgi:hypothetical protein